MFLNNGTYFVRSVLKFDEIDSYQQDGVRQFMEEFIKAQEALIMDMLIREKIKKNIELIEYIFQNISISSVVNFFSNWTRENLIAIIGKYFRMSENEENMIEKNCKI